MGPFGISNGVGGIQGGTRAGAEAEGRQKGSCYGGIEFVLI